MRIWCNTCLVCHTCFVKDPIPCGEAVVQVVDDAAEAAENSSEKEAKVRPKACLDPCTGQAGMCGKGRRDWTRARICDCLGAMGVKVLYHMNQRQARDIAMQQALPLLAQIDSDWVPPNECVTRSAAPPSSSQPCSHVPVDDMDGLIDE